MIDTSIVMKSFYKYKEMYSYPPVNDNEYFDYMNKIKEDAISKFKEKYNITSLETCRCYISVVGVPAVRYNVVVTYY